MPCQTLSSDLAQVDSPAGSLAADATPQAGAICRVYDFSPDLIVDFDGTPLVTFNAEPLVQFL